MPTAGAVSLPGLRPVGGCFADPDGHAWEVVRGSDRRLEEDGGASLRRKS